MKEYLPPLSEDARRWVRFGALIVAAVALVWLSRALSGVLTMLALSLALAYILNPVVTWVERRKVNRLTVIVAIYSVGFVLCAFGLTLLGTAAIAQWHALSDRLPEYVAQTQTWVAENYPELLPQAPGDPNAPAVAAADPNTADPNAPPPPNAPPWWPQQASRAWQGFALLGTAFSNLSSLLTALILVPMFTFFFLWQFEQMIATVRNHLPADWRPTIVHIVQLIDEKTAEFFRGRLITCFFVGLLTGLGWTFVGVPYSLPFGVAVGVLNLVPFLPAIVLPPVVWVIYADSAPGEYIAPVTLALVVFLLVQGFESFVLYPYLSARSSGLHPVTTIVALLIGAELAGLLGMLLSIPIASTLKALATEYVLPELKRLATAPPPDDPDPPPRESS